jgi:hypothetical protein
MALPLHCSLRDLVQVPADSCHLELDFAFVEVVVTVLAQSQQVCQRILATPTLIQDMMGF